MRLGTGSYPLRDINNVQGAQRLWLDANNCPAIIVNDPEFAARFERPWR